MKKQIGKYSLFIRDDEIDIRNFIMRYHFDKKDEELLAATAQFLTELVTVKAEIQYLEEKIGDYYFLDGDSLGEMEEWRGKQL